MARVLFKDSPNFDSAVKLTDDIEEKISEAAGKKVVHGASASVIIAILLAMFTALLDAIDLLNQIAAKENTDG